MMFSSKMSALMTVVVTVAIMAATVGEAQTPPSCASKLASCANYLNSTKPPAECCDPLKEAITKELDCLCKLYENPTVLSSFGINVTQALALPKACNIPGDLGSCTNGSVAPGPGSETMPPPATAGGKNDNNGVSKIAWTGISSLLVLCASLMLS